jgi:hypothetical protein
VRYEEGGGIWPHTDVADNEITLTLQLEVLIPLRKLLSSSAHFCSPDNLSQLTPAGGSWPLHVRLNNGTSAAVHMDDNDGVLYYGSKLVHWRDRMPSPHTVMQMIFAWRRYNEDGCVAQ